jgi:hypothetical protein
LARWEESDCQQCEIGRKRKKKGNGDVDPGSISGEEGEEGVFVEETSDHQAPIEDSRETKYSKKRAI